MTRTDYSHLEKLKEVEGKYLLRLANEVYEIQNTDQLTLLIFDHEPNYSVIPDEFGNFYKINETVLPVSFNDRLGNDYLKWVESTDLLYWTSELVNNENKARIKDSLFFSFNNKNEAKTAKLIINAGTTLWGSNMLLQMTALRGNKADEWFRLLENPAMYQQLEYWNKREELYRMNVKILIEGNWEKRGEIIGGGPFDIDTRVVPLDLDGVGENVKILITPPVGFWKINYAAMDFTETETVNYTEVYPSLVTNKDEEVTHLLTQIDHDYLVHPETGGEAFLEFESTRQAPNTIRTIYAKTTGYYDLLFNRELEPDNEVISKISFEPGYPVIWSQIKAKEFREKIVANKRQADEK